MGQEGSVETAYLRAALVPRVTRAGSVASFPTHSDCSFLFPGRDRAGTAEVLKAPTLREFPGKKSPLAERWGFPLPSILAIPAPFQESFVFAHDSSTFNTDLRDLTESSHGSSPHLPPLPEKREQVRKYTYFF